MARKKRQYAQEYARRVERALAKGLTRAQARGHPAAGTPYISDRTGAKRRTKPDPKLEDALVGMRKGESLSAAAKRLRVGRERLSAYAKRQAGAVRKGRAWTLNDTRKRRVPIIAEGSSRTLTIWVPDHASAALVGLHYAQASQAAENPELFPDLAAKWSGTLVTDTKGVEHFFATNENDIYRALFEDEIDWARIYHLQVH